MKIATISTTDITTDVENDVQPMQPISKLETESIISTTTKDAESLLTKNEEIGCNTATD